MNEFLGLLAALGAIVAIGAVIGLLLLFWFKMARDAYRKKRYIWLLFIIFGDIIISLLYYLIVYRNETTKK
jgi:integral membrane sensor domain MASE1